jgi:hypothetical protein
MFGIEVAESGAGVVGGEVPVDLTLGGVGGLLPGGEFGVEYGEVVDTAVEALAGECGEFDLGGVGRPLAATPPRGSTQQKIEQVPWRTYSLSWRRSCPGVAGIGSRAWARSW